MPENKMRKITPEAILSYPHLFVPNDRGKYTATLVFPPDTDLSEMKKWAFQAAVDALGEEKATKQLQTGQLRFVGGPHHVFRTDAEAKGYEPGSVFINCSSSKKPGIVDQLLNDITDPSRLYPGAIVKAHINPFYYDKEGNRGISWGLNNIQLWKDSEPLDGRARPQDVFTAMPPSDLGGPEEEDDLPMPRAASVSSSVLDDLLK